MNSLCSPIVQNAAPSSCICSYCSHCRHIWTMGGLNIVSWFVVIHFGSLVVHLGFSLISNSSAVSDQSKQTIYVKIPLFSDFILSYSCSIFLFSVRFINLCFILLSLCFCFWFSLISVFVYFSVFSVSHVFMFVYLLSLCHMS